MEILNEEATRPILFPVVQVIVVVVEDEIGQSTPSITTLMSSFTALKPVPLNVTAVPPVTGPNRGVIESRRGVKVPVYSI